MPADIDRIRRVERLGPLRLIGFAALGLVLAGAISAARVHAESALPATPFVEMMRGASSGVERWVAAGDGQAHALVAADPTFRSEELFGWGTAEYAYRGQRPLMGWIAWLLPLSPAAAIVAVFVLSGGLLAVGWSKCVPLRMVPPATLLVLVLCSRSPVVEPLGVGLLLLGTAAYRQRRLWPAVVLLALAGLCRETMLVVPAGIVLYELHQRRWRDGLVLASAAVPYAGWLVVLHRQTGAWPWSSGGGRLGVPFQGIVDASGIWQALEPMMVLVLIAALVACWRDGGWMRWVAAAHVVLLASLGVNVWASAFDFARVLLPVVVLGLVAISSRGGVDDQQAPRRSTIL